MIYELLIYELLFSIIGFSISFVVTSLILPFIIKSAMTSKMVTVDAHKADKPVISEPGGLGSLLAFSGSFSSVILIIVTINALDINLIPIVFDTTELANLMGALLAVVIAGLLGFVDDSLGISIKWRHKILLGFLPAFPLMILKIGTPDVQFPIIGVVEFGFVFALIIVPLATNFAFNSVNMLAGYNGLETGLGIVSFLTIFITSLYVNNAAIMLFSACMLGTLVILFKYNKYPAKTLIGDTGTLMIGTALIGAILLGNMERLALGIFLLYFINFVLFFVYIRSGQTQKLADIDIQPDGKVYLKPACPYSVYWIIPFYRKNITEKANVYILIGIQAVICFFTLIFFWSTT